jgi:hypothetical protein
MQRWVERALVDLQHVARDLLNALRDSPAMHGLERERLEDQHVQRALEDVVGFGWQDQKAKEERVGKRHSL